MTIIIIISYNKFKIQTTALLAASTTSEHSNSLGWLFKRDFCNERYKQHGSPK